MKATLRNVRIAPKKANLVAELVRGENVDDALRLLRFTPKKGAKILFKLIESAAANAENNFNQNKKGLVIKEIKVSKGLRLKRYIPVSRGRAHPLQKDCSHIHVFLEAETLAEAPKETKKVEAKAEAKKAPAKKAATKSTTKKTNKN